MRANLWIALGVAAIAIVFALQNPGIITLEFGPWEISGSTTLMLLATFAVGILVGTLTMLPGRWRQHREAKQLERRVEELESAPAKASLAAEAETESEESADSPISP
jgi:uncharacterized integral membrane protein